MKWIVLILILFCAGCSGASYDWDKEQELRGQKRMDCTGTKFTDESANVTNCPQIHPDKE